MADPNSKEVTYNVRIDFYRNLKLEEVYPLNMARAEFKVTEAGSSIVTADLRAAHIALNDFYTKQEDVMKRWGYKVEVPKFESSSTDGKAYIQADIKVTKLATDVTEEVTTTVKFDLPLEDNHDRTKEQMRVSEKPAGEGRIDILVGKGKAKQYYEVAPYNVE